MSSQRLIPTFAVLATLVVLANCENAVFGERRLGDELVKTSVVEAAAEGEGVILVAGGLCKLNNGKKITAIELVDRNGGKSSARAKIENGGPGEAFAVISIKTEDGSGIDYEVKYYAM